MVVGEIAKVISEGIKYLNLLLKTSHVRKLRKAVDAGETFINLFYGLAAEKDVKKKIHLRKRMNHIRKRFYKLNQG